MQRDSCSLILLTTRTPGILRKGTCSIRRYRLTLRVVSETVPLTSLYIIVLQ